LTAAVALTGGGSAWVYAKPAPATERWQPASGLTPGMLVYAQAGNASMDAARALAGGGPPGRAVHLSRLPDPSLGGSPLASGEPFAAYLLGHLLVTRPGPTWIAPLGPGSVAIDGKPLNPTRVSDKSGGTGELLDLAAGPHRVEAFLACPAPGRDPFRLAWRPPHTPPAELAPGADGVPDWDARPIRGDECARSGEGKVEVVEGRDGAPVAAFTATPLGYFQFTARPVVLFRLAALPSGAATVARAWEFGAGRRIEGQNEATWLLDGHADTTVTLRASGGAANSVCALAIRGAAPGERRSRLDSLADRNAYRQAMLAMLRASPPEADPTASWSEGLKDLLPRLIEPIQGRDLLSYAVSKRWKALRAWLPVEQRWRIEDLFMDLACTVDGTQAAKWVDVFEGLETDAERRRIWQVRRAEVQMYCLDKLDEAMETARRAADGPAESRAALRAAVRMGDVEFLRGRLDEATRLYGQAQNRAAPRRSAGAAGVDAWKVQAIRATSVSESTRHLLRQEFYEEARRALEDWELEFPMSKLSGDFVVAEAEYRLKIRDVARAQRSLGAYCRAMDLTNFLPDAMRLHMTTIFALRQGDRKAEEFVTQIRKRFPNHPIGEQAATLMKILKAHEVEREPTLDRL
jgi:tetratricopeptide (TPR) repeat protein